MTPLPQVARVNRRRAIKIVLMLVIPMGLLVVLGAVACSPLRRAPQSIRASLLKAMPLGTDVAVVRENLEKKFPGKAVYDDQRGFMKQENGIEVVGVSSIKVHLGTYRQIPIPLETDVTAFWGFDKGGKLIDVWVWKTTDAP